MRLALLALLVSVTVPACGTEDPYPWRPPHGGGPGGNDPGPDGGTGVDADSDGGGVAELAGRVCVIVDVTDPFACAGGTQAAGVDVTTTTGLTSAISDSNGNFTIAMPNAVDVLEVGAATTGLVPTRSFSDLTGPPVDAPVVDQVTFEGIIATLSETQTTGAMLIYVVDSAGPVAAATVTAPGRVIYYGDGAGSFDVNAVETAGDGLALVLDTVPATVSATDGTRTANASVPTANLGVGVGVITLTP